MDPKAVSALRIASRVLTQLGRKFVLIGATVPQILLDFRQEPGAGSRETRDLDALVEAHSWEDFARIRERLVEEGFEQGRVLHELWLNKEVQIDLIPYGAGLVEEDRLTWPDKDAVMSTFGMEEAFECARQEEVAPGLALPVVTVPGLILLKVVSYLGRPEERTRDLLDIVYCFEQYESAVGQSRRFDYCAGVEVDEKSITFEEAGAFLLGIEVAGVARPKSLQVVRGFLDGVSDEYAKPIGQILAQEKRILDNEGRRRMLYRLFRVFGTGLNRTGVI